MATTLGFIGLGVMGEAMCRNLAKKSGAAVVAHDTRPGPLEALGRDGVTAAPSTVDLVARAEIIFLCLPGEPQVRAVCLGAGGLASMADITRLTEPDCAALAGAISGRALYDGRIDPAQALALLRQVRPEHA